MKLLLFFLFFCITVIFRFLNTYIRGFLLKFLKFATVRISLYIFLAIFLYSRIFTFSRSFHIFESTDPSIVICDGFMDLKLPDTWISFITDWFVVQGRETSVINLLPGGNNARSCESAVIARHRSESTLVSCLIVRLTFNSKSCVALPWPWLELIHAFSRNARVAHKSRKTCRWLRVNHPPISILNSRVRAKVSDFPIVATARYQSVFQT